MKYWDWLSPFAMPLCSQVLSPHPGFVSISQAPCDQIVALTTLNLGEQCSRGPEMQSLHKGHANEPPVWAALPQAQASHSLRPLLPETKGNVILALPQSRQLWVSYSSNRVSWASEASGFRKS